MLHALHGGLSEAPSCSVKDEGRYTSCCLSATMCGGKQLGKTKTWSLCPSLQDHKGSREVFLKIHWGSHGLGRVPGSETGAKMFLGPVCKHQVLLDLGYLRTRTRKQTPLTVSLEETAGKGTTQDYSECLLALTQPSFTVSRSNLLLFEGLESGLHGSKLAALKVEPRMLHSLYKWNGACKSPQVHAVHHPKWIRQ